MDIAEALDQLEQLGQWFNMLMESSPRHFADKVYHDYISTFEPSRPRGCRRPIETAIARLSHLKKSGHEYEHVILNVAGVGKEMERVQNVLKPVHQLVTWLEDILCTAMESLDDLQSKYNNKDLAFCSNDD